MRSIYRSFGPILLIAAAACDDDPTQVSVPQDGPANSKAQYAVSVTDPAFGATCGGGDDTQAFQAAVNAARNVYVPGCDFHIASTVNVPTDTRIHGDGAASRLIAATPGMYAILDAVGPNDGAVYDVVVESLGFLGNNEPWHHAFRARWGQRIRFSDNVVRNTGMINVDNSNGVEVLRNDGSASIIEYLNGVDLNHHARNVTVRANTVHSYGSGIQWWGGEADPRKNGFDRTKRTGNHTISGNTVHHNINGIWGGNGEHITVTGNNVQVCKDVCLDAEGSHDVRFAGNTARFAGNEVLAAFFYSTDIVFEDNIVEQSGNGYWPGHEAEALTGMRLFYLANASNNPDAISVTLRRNQFSYTGSGSSSQVYTVGLVEKDPSALVVIDDNQFSNTIVHMVPQNSGTVRVINNDFTFDRTILVDGPADRYRFAAIHLEKNSYTPTGGALAEISGNQVHTSAFQGASAVFVGQNTTGPAVSTIIENNTIRGFGTAIRYKNEIQPNSWRIVGNTTNGIWWVNPSDVGESEVAPSMVMRNNGIGIHSWYKYEDRLWGHDLYEGFPGGYERSRLNWFYVVGRAPSSAYVQIFRCRMSGPPYRHFLTTSTTCNGDYWATRDDLGGMYGIRPGYQGSFPGVVPLYRLHYPANGDIYFTADEAEKNDIVAGGWQMQGIIAYVWR